MRLNRPEAHNALNAALLADLMGALRTFEDDLSVGAMVVTGSERSFSVGADIKELAGLSPGEMIRADRIAAFDRLQSFHKPVVAAVSGWCLGGGFELALGCDLIVAADTARFGLPEVTIGVIPGAGGTQRTHPRRGQSPGDGDRAQQPHADGGGSAGAGTGQPGAPGGGLSGCGHQTGE